MTDKIKLKKGDSVKIIAGKDNGKIGVIESVMPAQGKILVKGVNMYKKNVKPSQKYPTGGIIDINKGINTSNAILVCPNCGKNTRVGYSIEKGTKIRICKKCGKSVEGGAK